MPISIPFNITPNKIKRAGAAMCDILGINRIGFELQKKRSRPFIRAVNYHVLRPDDRKAFEQHLRFYSEEFCSVDRQTLELFLNTGAWTDPRPGLIISFDDGHRSHYDIAAPLLKKYNFVGWFFVPVGLMNTEDGLIRDVEALTAEQMKYLAINHVVGSHSQTHCRLSSSVPLEKLKHEILDSQKNLESVVGRTVDTFCWVGGEEETYSREAASLIKGAYKYSFMTNNAIIRPNENPLQLQRTNIEAENPMSLVRFQLSGIMDILYKNKRERVNRLTA